MLLHHIGDIRIDGFRYLTESRNPDLCAITYFAHTTRLHTAILSVNKQTYQEASGVLYSENGFSFCSDDLEFPFFSPLRVVSFLQALSEGSRRLIRRLTYWNFIVLSTPGFDDFYIEKTCDYLSKNLDLDHLTLIITSTTPFRARRNSEYTDYLCNIDQQTWVQHLIPLVRKLKTIKIVERIRLGETLVARAAQNYLESKMSQGRRDSAQDSV